MENSISVAKGSFLLGLIVFASACVVAPREGAPREGYYDRDQHRYYHEHTWHDCGEHDDHCR